MTLTLLSSHPRKILVVVGLAASLFAAMPANAAPPMQFGFSFGTDNGNFSFSLGNGGYNGRFFETPETPDRHPVCLTDKQLRAGLRGWGYSGIDFGQERQGWIHTMAWRNGRAYEFDVNRCTGELANIWPVTRWGYSYGTIGHGGHDNDGFGFDTVGFGGLGFGH